MSSTQNGVNKQLSIPLDLHTRLVIIQGNLQVAKRRKVTLIEIISAGCEYMEGLQDNNGQS